MKQVRLGKLPPMYRFLLNSLEEARFTSCPECHQRTLLRKIPLVVHVDPRHPVVLNKGCRYCPDCDLLIVHQDELELLLVLSLQEQFPEAIGNDYLVLGTLDKSTWRRRDKEALVMGSLPAKLHDFKEYLNLIYTPAGWYPEDQPPAPRPEPPLAKPTGWQQQEAVQTLPTLSIDDPQQVADLMEKMESHLPIPAELTRAAANFLRREVTSYPLTVRSRSQPFFTTGMKVGLCVRYRPSVARRSW